MIGFIGKDGGFNVLAKSLTAADHSDIQTITAHQPEYSTQVAIKSEDIVDKATPSDLHDLISEVDDILGDNKDKLINLGLLYHYHKMLMKSLPNETKLEANLCTRCGGLLDENLKCIFCGTQHRLVAQHTK